MFNEIDGDFDDVAIRTFKVGLPTEHDLRKSLTKKPIKSVMFVARTLAKESSFEPKRIKGNALPILGFSEEDKIRTIQPHNDALVVTLRIGGYNVKRVMVDQGSGADIMYPDLFKGLNLRLEDLIVNDSPLISFKGKTVIPKGQIRLPMQSGSEVVEVDFIVVDAYSPYTAIVARLWLHALGAVSSTLHLKVKFLSRDQVEKLTRSQSVGVQLPPQEKAELVTILKKNVDVFAWNTYEAPGVDLSFIYHHLNVNPAVLEKTIKVYMDDMVVKIKTVSMHVEDLNDTFQTLRRYKLRLNASKCSFGVGFGKFLGYMVTHRGIKVNPVQVKAINSL
ncbi:uncharacterized protein LOC142625055 [Castanea sativa]|uniref:uncharacterized protein LOC142625055 n=1 Tax=Castanea sativa TaxID=21020 RepID=UPI003F64CAAC